MPKAKRQLFSKKELRTNGVFFSRRVNSSEPLRQWVDLPLSIGKSIGVLFPPATGRDFKGLKTSSGTLYASRGHLYKDAVFGRDSIESAEDLINIDQKLVRGAILKQAELQGVVNNPVNEEEPGRIAHEFRSRIIDGRVISEESLVVFQSISSKWGGSDESMVYYGSVDSTPLFARLVSRYCKRYGRAFLSQQVTRLNGSVTTVRECLLAATNWIIQKINNSDMGFVEFQSSNPFGLRNQVWTDSATAYVHTNGSSANHKAPIAPIEVQGYCYDAIMGVAELLEPAEAGLYRRAAEQLRDNILEYFWNEKGKYFVSALDRHPKTKKVRQIQVPSSNDGLLLETTLFDRLTNPERDHYVCGIIDHLYDQEFITDVGVRCRAKSFAEVVNFQDYHGSWAVWTKQTFDIAKGLRYQGFPRLAQQLETRILNGVAVAGVNYEFFYVDLNGTVVYHPKSLLQSQKVKKIIIATNIPEGGQSWTVTAVMAIKQRQFRKSPVIGSRDQRKFENKMLKKVPRKGILDRSGAILLRKKTEDYAIDLVEGVRRDSEWNPDWWGKKEI